MLTIKFLPHHKENLSLEDMNSLAEIWVPHYLQDSSHPILMSGILGAGKSTFVKYCLSSLGLITERQPFASPSFGIIHEYYPTAISPQDINYPVYHIDLYRLHSLQEVDNLGLFDIIEQHISFIEWPERIDNKIPQPYYTISLDIRSEHTRDVSISRMPSTIK